MGKSSWVVMSVPGQLRHASPCDFSFAKVLNDVTIAQLAQNIGEKSIMLLEDVGCLSLGREYVGEELDTAKGQPPSSA
jgi:hypothetical protein